MKTNKQLLLRTRLFILSLCVLFVTQVRAQVSAFTFTTTNNTYMPITGQNVFPSTWDDENGSVSIGFTYTLNGTTFSSVNVNSNGYVTLGSTIPGTTGFTPISATDAYNGAIAAFARDLVNDGTPSSSVTYTTTGVSPNRKFTVQWANAQRYSGGAVAGDNLNFQIILNEGTNRIDIMYGACTATSTSNVKGQVGLRGAANTDFNARSGTNNTAWTALTAATSNADNVNYKSTVLPASGLTFSWIVPTCFTPNALTTANTTTSTTTLSWALPTTGTPGNYNYEIRTSGAAGSGATGLVTSGTVAAPSTSVGITGLSASTSYTAYVRSDCGAGDFSTWKSVTIVTACGPISSFPWNEDFESLPSAPGAGILPICWTYTNIAGTNPPGTSVGDTYRFSRSGTNLLYSQYNNTALVFTPAFQLTAGVNYDFSFYMRNYDSSPITLDVAYGTAGTEAAMTNTLLTAYSAVNTTYTLFKYTITPATTGVYYFGVKSTSPTTAPWYLSFDDFKLELTPSCVPPTALTTVNTTTGTTTVNWTAPLTGTPANYIYEIRTSGAAGSGTTGLATTGTVTVPTTSVIATGLSANTNYSVYVQSNCGAGNLSAWSQFNAFATPCSATNIPYTQDFESATIPAMPSCTSVENVGTGNAWRTYSNPGYGFTSNALNYNYNSNNAANTWFYTQGLNLTSGVSYRLTYRYGNSSGAAYPESMKVNYGTSPAAAAMTTTLTNHLNLTNDSPITTTVDFIPSATGVYYIGFNAYSDANMDWLMVDDITVNLSPSCIEPSAVTLAGITSTTAIATWTAGGTETAWDVYYGPSPLTAPGATTVPTATTSVNSFSLTGLTPSANYVFYVRAHCSAVDQSNWAGPKTFLTPCLPPNITGTTGGIRCGIGSTSLTATADPGAITTWYTAATGGAAVATGSVYTTPSITTTTNYYVSASSPPVVNTGGITVPTGTVAYSPYADGLIFNATQSFTLASVDVYPKSTTGGDIEIELYDNGLNFITSYTMTLPAATGTTAVTVPVNFYIPQGTGYYLISQSSPNLILNTTGVSYPYTLGNVGSITSGFDGFDFIPTSTEYFYFYNLKWLTICEGARTAVTATVTPPPALSVTSGTTVCANVVVTSSVTSTLADYNSYVWSPATNLYTNAAATTAYTGGTATTVYFKSPTGGTTNYTVTANNSTSQCANVANVSLSVDVPAISAMSSASIICVGTTATLTAQSAPSLLGVGTLTTTGSGTSGGNYVSPYSHYFGGYKGQYLLSASELTASGLTPGNITSLALNVVSAGTTYNGFAINMAATTQSAATTTFVTPVTNVYTANTTPVVGINTYNFTTPFNWNGTSNVIVEITWSNNNGGGTAAEVTYDATSFASTAYFRADNQTATAVATQTTATGTVNFRPAMKLVATNPNYSFQWNPGAINGNTTTVTPNVTVSTPLSYTVSVVNAATTCSNTAVLTVTANPTPTVTASSLAPAICSGKTTTLTATGATTYTWMPAGGSAATTTVTPPSTRVYTVTGTSLGCSDTKTVNITVTPTPTITSSASPSVICSGATVSLTATGAANYTWTPAGVMTSSATVTPTATTVYSVTGETSGCASTKTVNVTVNNIPVINLSPLTTICTTGGSATLTATGTSTAYVWSNGPTTATNVVTPSTQTSYTVTGTNSCGTKTATTSVALGTAPTVSATTSATLICDNNSVVISASGTATTYTWSTGATTQSITVTPTITTVYIVNSTNACGTASATVIQNVSPCTGLEEAFNSDAVSIYPNPANEYINIAIPASLTTNTTLVEVTDALGKLVMKETLNTDVTTIRLDKLEDGVYFFKVISNSQTVKVGKVVKH